MGVLRKTGFSAAISLALWAGIAAAQAGPALYAGVGGTTLVPFGWADFCDRYRGECATEPSPAMDVNWTASTRQQIETVNSWVNTTVKPLSDQDHWGVVDQWDYPTDGLGDCEDYVLMKRKMLMKAGFPRSGLLVTVVRDQHGEGHAVLTVKTNRGEFVLDNMTSDVRLWSQTPYRYIKRQSQTDPNVWVSLGEPSSPASVASSR